MCETPRKRFLRESKVSSIYLSLVSLLLNMPGVMDREQGPCEGMRIGKRMADWVFPFLNF